MTPSSISSSSCATYSLLSLPQRRGTLALPPTVIGLAKALADVTNRVGDHLVSSGWARAFIVISYIARD